MKELLYKDFIRELNKKAVRRRIPWRAIFELTHRCNHRCLHCYVNPVRKDFSNGVNEDPSRCELSTDEVISILTQLADFGILRVGFTGGEIFLRDDILRILTFAREIGLEVSILTNGTLITGDVADTLIGYGINRFDVSFLGASPQTFDMITQIPGTYQRALAVVKMLKGKGARVALKTCVLNINLEEVDKIMGLANDLGVSFSYSPFVTPRLDGERNPLPYRLPPQEFMTIRRRMQRAMRRLRGTRASGSRQWSMVNGQWSISNQQSAISNGHRASGNGESVKNPTNSTNHNPQITQISQMESMNPTNSTNSTNSKNPINPTNPNGGLFDCAAGRSMVFVDPYGIMKACVLLPFPGYEILKGSVEQGWEEVKKFVDDARPPPDWRCNSCELLDFCGWCPAAHYLNSGDIAGCHEYAKEVAHLRRERAQNRELSSLSSQLE